MMRKRDRIGAVLTALLVFAPASVPAPSALGASESARPLRSNKRLSRHSIPIVNVDGEEQLPPAPGSPAPSVPSGPAPAPAPGPATSDVEPGPLNAPPVNDRNDSVAGDGYEGDLLADSPWVGDEYLDAAGPVFLPNMLGDFVGDSSSPIRRRRTSTRARSPEP